MILVTGGAGFIGENFVLELLSKPDGDIGDSALVANLLAQYKPRSIINFAAESYVNRSIHGSKYFIQTNIVGTFRLLKSVRAYWGNLKGETKQNDVASLVHMAEHFA